MVACQVKRVSKMEAVNILDVSLSTVERMIKRGELQVEKEDLGGRHRVWILLDQEDADLAAAKSAEYSPEGPADRRTMSEREELITLRVQVKGFQDLSDYRGELLKQSDLRFQELLQQMNALTKALPAGVDTSTANSDKKGWSWWPWRRGETTN